MWSCSDLHFYQFCFPEAKAFLSLSTLNIALCGGRRDLWANGAHKNINKKILS
jgi:hypothetical protein